ncbi:hypothetical protein IHE49_01615 [Rhodanobacter sp. 7MK24]|uniref:hypothetical protein n=1 Tax=Rhodanobacter sp. 7MK24 TaxID=2775922 RepID=UPI001784CBBE|nr:hypothetical protein [Rhodanobacter sp. 7MK24]MBD8879174.1 hypothetical protein [Rhodanobacter sp. 7MK24]
MMPTSNPPSIPPVPADMSPPMRIEPAAGSVEKSALPHADYNLLPLKVDSLGHYLSPSEEQEEGRFHVR